MVIERKAVVKEIWKTTRFNSKKTHRIVYGVERLEKSDEPHSVWHKKPHVDIFPSRKKATAYKDGIERRWKRMFG